MRRVYHLKKLYAAIISETLAYKYLYILKQIPKFANKELHT